MSFDLVLRGGRVIDPSQGIDAVADVGFEDGRVAEVGTDLVGDAIRNVSGGRRQKAIAKASPRPPAANAALDDAARAVLAAMQTPPPPGGRFSASTGIRCHIE